MHRPQEETTDERWADLGRWLAWSEQKRRFLASALREFAGKDYADLSPKDRRRLEGLQRKEESWRDERSTLNWAIANETADSPRALAVKARAAQVRVWSDVLDWDVAA